MAEEPIWYVLVRFGVGQNTPPVGGVYPKEGYPISVHVDKNWWGDSVDGKEWKVVAVRPVRE